MDLRFVAAAGFALVASITAVAQPQKVDKEEVSFKTFDGVLLKGHFYRSAKGGNSPVVMLLHKLGGASSQGAWGDVAAKLQQKGYAVLSFDFRGHGASTTIDNPTAFWSEPHNQTHLKNRDPKKNKLSFKDFETAYIPFLVNDIAAARHDLDNRNDNGECNTSNIILIGAEDGAALGFFWIASEYQRPAVNLVGAIAARAPLNNDPAGGDVAGAIWLSLKRAPSLDKTSKAFPFASLVKISPPMRDKVPMWFAAGSKDREGFSDANFLYDKVLDADRKKGQLTLTSKKTVDGTDLRGIGLVGQNGLKVDDLIETFIDKAVKVRPNQAVKKRNAGAVKPAAINPVQFGFGR